MRQLQLDDAEYALLIAINIFSADRPNVQDHGLVEVLQQPYIEALSSYIRLHRPQVSGLAGKVARGAEAGWGWYPSGGWSPWYVVLAQEPMLSGCQGCQAETGKSGYPHTHR